MWLLSNKALVKILSILLLSNLGQCSGSCLQRDPGLVELCLKQREIAKEEKKEEAEEEGEEKEGWEGGEEEGEKH